MADVATLVDKYIATWNERDAGLRRALIAQTFADDGDYLDPLMQGDGQVGIDAMIAGVQQQYGECRLELAAGPDAHNDRVRVTWQAGADARRSRAQPLRVWLRATPRAGTPLRSPPSLRRREVD
jgi:SnoaL-like domain